MKLRAGISSFLVAVIREHLVYVFLIGVIILAAVVSPVFFQPKNLFNVLRQASALGILAVGQTVVVISGGIDLSVAAVMQLAGVTVAEITKGSNTHVVVALAAVLAVGALIGFGNGLLVAKRRVQPFISTLFVGLLVTGLRLLVTRATPSGVLPPAVRTLGSASLGPVPNAVIIFAGIALLVSVILVRTTWGRKIFAVGGNPRAASLNGISVDRITIVSYVVCGCLAAVSGIVLVGYLGYADQEIGTGYDLDSIAAVAVGGAVLGGGKGRVSGTIAGVLLMAILLNLVLLLKLKVEYQLVLRGLVILGAVAFYSANWTGLRVRLARASQSGGSGGASG
ncbi:MAG: ABC transporter permease [Spirochaetia bacterium]|jgi:ribose/xylose/arabinose/galactoside ABC-type transport system permease subunit